MSESIEDTIPYPQSALGQALLLGRRGNLPPEMVQDFRSTGASHLLAISGLYVGVLVFMFASASAWLLGRRGSYFLIVPLIVIWVYALVSGLPPSVVRAAIMGSVYLFAVAVGRPGSVLPALALIAGVMTAISPEIIQRVSFQLSFAAVGGIALAQSLLPLWPFAAGGQNRNWWLPWALPLLRTLSLGLVISLAATLATWPLIAFNFQEVALLGVIVTVLALPAMPFIMGGTLLAAVLGLFSVAVGQFFGWLVWAPSSYLIELVESVPSQAGAEYWARIVRDKAVLRKLIEVSGKVLHDAYTSVTPSHEQVEAAEQAIFNLAEQRGGEDATELKTLLQDLYAQLEAQEGRHITGLETGFFDLDEKTSGLQNGEMIIVAGRPSMGKTALAASIDVG